MAQSKDIELILQARLEEGNSLTTAQSMGKGIADSLEKAFEGMGERIADKLMRALSDKLQGFSKDLDSNLGLNSAHSSIPSLYERKFSAYQENALKQRIRTPDQIAEDFNINPAEYSSDAGKRFRDNHFQGRNLNSDDLFGTLGKVSDLALARRGRAMGIKDKDYDEWMGNQRDNVIQADSIVESYKNFKTAKDLGSNASIEDFDLSKDKISNARAEISNLALDSAKVSDALAKEIAELRIALNRNTEATEKEKVALGDKADDKEALAELRKDTLRTKLASQEKTTEDKERLQSLSGTLKDMESDSQELNFFGRNQRKIATGMAVAGTVGTAMSMAGELDYIEARAAAGTKSLQSFAGRDISSLDYTKMAATDLWGGDKELENKAWWNSFNKVGGGLIQGAAQTLGGVAIAAKTGPIGWLPGAAIARDGISRLASGYSQIKNFDGTTEQEMRRLQGAKVEEYRDVFQLADQGRSIYRNAYSDAQNLGAEELDNWFVGGEGAKGLRAYSSHVANVNQSSFERGLREFSQVVRPIRNGKDMLQEGGAEGQAFESNYQQSLLLQGKGYSNATTNAGMFYRGASLGETQNPNQMGVLNKNMMDHNHLYAELLKSGLDKQSVNDLMNDVSGMAGSRMGNTSIAIDYARDVAKGSQQYGGNPSAMMSVSQAVQQRTQDISAGDHIGGASRLQAIRELEEERIKNGGRALTDVERARLYTKNVTDETADKLLGISAAEFNNKTLDKVNQLDPTGLMREFSSIAENTDDAEVQLKARMGGFTGKDEDLKGKGPKISETMAANTHTSDQKKLVQFENATELEKTLASFEAMDRVMPDLNEKFAQFIQWLKDVGSQMDEMNLAPSKRGGSKETMLMNQNPASTISPDQKMMNMMNSWMKSGRARPPGSGNGNVA